MTVAQLPRLSSTHLSSFDEEQHKQQEHIPREGELWRTQVRPPASRVSTLFLEIKRKGDIALVMKLTPFLLFDGNCAYEKNVFLFLRKHGLCRRAETSAPARLSLSKPEQAERVMMQNLPTGTVTLLFTDIAGSTRLLTQLGDRYTSVLLTAPRGKSTF